MISDMRAAKVNCKRIARVRNGCSNPSKSRVPTNSTKPVYRHRGLRAQGYHRVAVMAANMRFLSGLNVVRDTGFQFRSG